MSRTSRNARRAGPGAAQECSTGGPALLQGVAGPPTEDPGPAERTLAAHEKRKGWSFQLRQRQTADLGPIRGQQWVNWRRGSCPEPGAEARSLDRGPGTSGARGKMDFQSGGVRELCVVRRTLCSYCGPSQQKKTTHKQKIKKKGKRKKTKIVKSSCGSAGGWGVCVS